MTLLKPTLVAVLVLGPLAVAVQEAGESVVQRGAITEDLYLAGGNVEVRADVVGDVVAAGGRVLVDQRVDGDVMVAGGAVDVRAEVLDDVRVAGGAVTIHGPVAGDAIAAGASVTLATGSRVGGRAWLAGGRAEVAGQVERELKVSAEEVVISGTVAGDVDVTAGELEVGPQAHITGNLRYRGPREARIDPAARIDGDVLYQRAERERKGANGGFRAIVTAGVALLGIVLFLLFPRFATAAARTVASDPWASLGLGLVIVIGAPILTLTLAITLIGIPLAFVTALVYVLALMTGYLTAAFFLADLGLRRLRDERASSRGWQVASLVIALVLLAVVRLVPYLGGLVTLLVLVFGSGALGLGIYRLYNLSSSRPAAPASP